MFGSSPDLTGWAALVALGVVQLGLSYILFAAAVKHASALDSILVPTIEPLLNPDLGLLAAGGAPRTLGAGRRRDRADIGNRAFHPDGAHRRGRPRGRIRERRLPP